MGFALVIKLLANFFLMFLGSAYVVMGSNRFSRILGLLLVVVGVLNMMANYGVFE